MPSVTPSPTSPSNTPTSVPSPQAMIDSAMQSQIGGQIAAEDEAGTNTHNYTNSYGTAQLMAALSRAAVTPNPTSPSQATAPAPASAPLGSSGASSPPAPGYSVPSYSFANGKFSPNGGTETLTGPGFGGAPGSPSTLTSSGGATSSAGGFAAASPTLQNTNYPADNAAKGSLGTGSGPIFGAGTGAILDPNGVFGSPQALMPGGAYGNVPGAAQLAQALLNAKGGGLAGSVVTNPPSGGL